MHTHFVVIANLTNNLLTDMRQKELDSFIKEDRCVDK